MYHLHFLESSQKFTIIKTGNTITPAHHGELVCSHESQFHLAGMAKAFLAIRMVEGRSFTLYEMQRYFAEINQIITVKDTD